MLIVTFVDAATAAAIVGTTSRKFGDLQLTRLGGNRFERFYDSLLPSRDLSLFFLIFLSPMAIALLLLSNFNAGF